MPKNTLTPPQPHPVQHTHWLGCKDQKEVSQKGLPSIYTDVFYRIAYKDLLKSNSSPDTGVGKRSPKA